MSSNDLGIRYTKPVYKYQVQPKSKHHLVLAKLVENGRNGEKPKPIGAILIEAGYSPNTAKAPTKVTQSLGFQELLEEVLPDHELVDTHKALLRSMKLDHMVFPLGPADEHDPNFSGANPDAKNQIEVAGAKVERTTLSDGEIKTLIADVGGQVRRIVHGDTARHVYFWAPNEQARHNALKLAYDLKGKIEKGKPDQPGNTYNTQVNINDGSPRGDQLVDAFTEFMLKQTSAKAIDDN